MKGNRPQNPAAGSSGGTWWQRTVDNGRMLGVRMDLLQTTSWVPVNPSCRSGLTGYGAQYGAVRDKEAWICHHLRTWHLAPAVLVGDAATENLPKCQRKEELKGPKRAKRPGNVGGGHADIRGFDFRPGTMPQGPRPNPLTTKYLTYDSHSTEYSYS